jgi:hypothetical protein
MINKAREIIAISKSNIAQMQGFLKQKHRMSNHSVMTFKNLITGDRELIQFLNNFIKSQI